MPKAAAVLWMILAFPLFFFGQSEADSATTLDEVIIKAYEQNRQLKQVPAAINFIGKARLERFNNVSIVSAINSTPGVKMEERSPGSYRLNIRGSSLRSPFGVRNVKIYFNDLPYTDPGGNSYLNQLGFYNFHTIELIKGPGSSLYGAGTGGTILIRSVPEDWKPGLALQFTAGSFNHHNANAQLQTGRQLFRNAVNFQHQSSYGYRNHTEMRRDALAWHSKISWKSGSVRTYLLLGDLYYETPGGLTRTEYEQDPKRARPAVPPFPSAEASKAAIFQRMAFGGAVLNQSMGNAWSNLTALYSVHSQLKNPTFRNYGIATEPHRGGRTLFRFRRAIGKSMLSWLSGAEFQKSFTKFSSYTNTNGNAGMMISDDRISNTQYFFFSQVDLEFAGQWFVTGGLSLNKLKVKIRRLFPGAPLEHKRIYSNEIAPRIAVLKRINDIVSIYGSVSRGFSPPTIAEVLPSSNIINTGLDAESGINYEVGARTNLLGERLYIDMNAFYFRLENTIVQRRDASGADFFVNAGSTEQKGIEAFISWRFLDNVTGPVSSGRLSVSHTFHHFRYRDFKQLNNDFSGKELPSVPPHTLVAMLDLQTTSGLYLNVTHNYTEKIPLNDANTEYAKSYHLLDARVGYRLAIKADNALEFFGGINNALDVKYSLGNDINAFGGRYFNAAPARNYFVGMGFSLK